MIQIPDSIDYIQVDPKYGYCDVQPLERGYGVTLGNVMRRVLLSSIPGYAVIAAKINDVTHEYTSIEGVKEDVFDILFNLKKLRFKSDDIIDRGFIHVKKSGAGSLTGDHINEASNDYEILNKDLIIATLDDDANLDIELHIGYGFGYEQSEQHDINRDDMFLIPLDAIFSPIHKVSYKVEKVLVRQRTDYEKLRLEIVTDGTITAEEACSEAGSILTELIDYFVATPFKKIDLKRNEKPYLDKNYMANLLQTPIDELNLSVRAYNCLKNAKIHTIADIVSKRIPDMLSFRNFGKKSINELINILKERNLEFGMDISPYVNKK